MAKKYLHLCSMGINRAPTSASVAREINLKKGLDIEMFSGGFDNIPKDMSSEQQRNNFEQYDLIIVMEEYMGIELLKLGISKKIIRCLNIPDNYQKNEPVLREILRNNLELYVREKPL